MHEIVITAVDNIRYQKHADVVFANQKKRNVVDFSEKRMLLVAKSLKPKLQKKLLQLIMKYRDNQIAVGWKDGFPVFVNIDINNQTVDNLTTVAEH